jgi:hypothetical protein
MKYFQHYFQSGKGYASTSGLTGKSLLTIEWTNQHGCGDRDLNCNFVLQYRCQDDANNQKLNHHSMRNGKKSVTPSKTGYQKVMTVGVAGDIHASELNHIINQK